MQNMRIIQFTNHPLFKSIHQDTYFNLPLILNRVLLSWETNCRTWPSWAYICDFLLSSTACHFTPCFCQKL